MPDQPRSTKSEAQRVGLCPKEAQVQSRSNKYVTRYRRTKNLVKKCSEISSQCELDIILVLFDRKANKFREVHTSRELTVSDMNRMLLDD